ncbi:hypothetical protein BS78_07G084700 [Paspalum vaginatum]|nr:hypothetical protein BS78_07G084700 [Paspalum vaginatum]
MAKGPKKKLQSFVECNRALCCCDFWYRQRKLCSACFSLSLSISGYERTAELDFFMAKMLYWSGRLHGRVSSTTLHRHIKGKYKGRRYGDPASGEREAVKRAIPDLN